MRNVVLIAHNLRSCHNVGSLLRTADAMGVKKLYLTGYTPYPKAKNDARLPHIASKMHRQIQKTALGAENSQDWEFHENISKVFERLHLQGYKIAALEQKNNAIEISSWKPGDKIALVVGRETKGVEAAVLRKCDLIVEIPMYGSKESLNVTQAAAMGLFYLRFTK